MNKPDLSPRLLRGGSWFDGPLGCRSAYRNSYHPALLIDSVGFRICTEDTNSMKSKTARGGAWCSWDSMCRSACRLSGPPDLFGDGIGFRICTERRKANITPFLEFVYRQISKLMPKNTPSPFYAVSEPSLPSLRLVRIPAGRFLMGSPADEEGRSLDEGPQHEVSLKSFFMADTPITQAQWREVAGWRERAGEHWGMELEPEPSHFEPSNDDFRRFFGEANSDQRPVECVNWFQAMEFCSRLSQRTRRRYTLPSEAQWEYACRAGTTTPFHFGGTITPKLANYDSNSTFGYYFEGFNRMQTSPVRVLPSNAWGLYDMHGNVWEWCLDHWHDNYNGAPTDGSAWLENRSGEERLAGDNAA